MAFGDKDFLQAIQGAWIIEIPDMTGFSRREHSQILATISIRTDVYRRSYGRYTEQHPRVAVFAATSETDDYLSDTPRAPALLAPALQGDRFGWRCAPSVSKSSPKRRSSYRAGTNWHVMPDTTDTEQLDRAPEDIWTDKVIGYADMMWAQDLPVTSARILCDAIEMKMAQQGDSDKRRIARIMRECGWIQYRDARGRRWKKVVR